MNDRKICLCTIFNDNYFKYSSLMILSFIMNNKWFNGDFVCLYDDKYVKISDETKIKVSNIYQKTRFLKINDDIYEKMVEKWKKDEPKFTERWKTVFLKNEIFRMSEYDCILFLDSDVIINENIKDLFYLKDGCYFCLDEPMCNKGNDGIREKTEDDYINAGLVILSGKAVINDDYYKYVCDSFFDNKITFFPEQDIWSKYVKEKCFILPNRTFQLTYYWGCEDKNAIVSKKLLDCRIIHYTLKYDKIKNNGFKILKQLASYYETFLPNNQQNLISHKNYENDRIDLFVCSHSHYSIDILTKTYKNISNIVLDRTFNKQLCEKNVPEVTDMQRSYGECSRMYWVWKKYEGLKDYVGFCHYRRFFNFYEDIPDIDELFSIYDAIITKENFYQGITVKKHFSSYHNIKFLYEWTDIINELYPEYTKKEINMYLNSRVFCLRNMFILKKDDFYTYMQWCFSIAEEYNRRNNLKTQNDVTDFCKRKCSEFGIPYQEHYDRLHGFLFEICQGLYFKHNFKRILGLPIKMVE